MTTITLPYPPTVNHYWKTRVIQGKRGKAFATHYISAQGKVFRDAVIIACRGMTVIDGVVAVSINAFPPDRRIRDLDNILKPLLDAMTAAGLWNDDSQVDDLHIVRRDIVSGGRVDVCVKNLESHLF